MHSLKLMMMPLRLLHVLASSFFRPVYLARILFILLVTWCAMLLAQEKQLVVISFFGFEVYQRWLYSMIGFFAGVVFIIIEYSTDAISSHKILMAAVGMMVGLIFASLFYTTIPEKLADPETARIICNLFFGYFGIVLAIKHAERFHLSRLKFFLSQSHERPKILDSSVIIDGRVRDLIDLQVITGPIVIPNFVLLEIQNIADSSDPNRKARGRRGLDVLEALRESCKTMEVTDKDFPMSPGVDQKLVQLSREMDAELVTNDYNLQKIAQLHKIPVLNLNEVANALKPTVYIGEMFSLVIVREGKEQGQGVGYLEDGTMVVVDDANMFMGREIPVVVSSILQTSSGRLVFARTREDESMQRARA